MLNRTKSSKEPGIDHEVSEYIWDIKSKRFIHNPDYRSGRFAARYILWGAIVLIILIAVAWCFRRG